MTQLRYRDLRYRDFDLSDRNLFKLISEVVEDHEAHGNVAFATYCLVVELEKRLLGVESLQEKSDSGLFECLIKGLTVKLECWARNKTVYYLRDGDLTKEVALTKVDPKTEDFFRVGNGDDPLYNIKVVSASSVYGR